MSTQLSLESLVGQVASHIWFSDYFVCYIELGELSLGRIRRDGSVGNSIGEITIFLGYDWKAKSADSNILRKDLQRSGIEAFVGQIKGATVTSVTLVDDGQEIEIGFSTGITLVSVSPENEQPDWDVGFGNYQNGYFCIEDGKLQFRR